MKNLLLILILAAVTACCPCRHLTTSTADSVRVETIVRTEYIPDTVLVEDTTSHLETSFAVSDARINADGSLSHSLANKPQKRPIPTEKEVIYRDSIVYRDRVNTEIVEVERKLTWWQQTKMKGFWVLLVVIVFVFRKNIVTLARRLI